jgi:electron transfer flavoprotein beta subunit
MKIAVCLKYGLDVDEIKVDQETGELRLTNVPRKFGDYDYNALTEAARLGQEEGNQVTILVFGVEAARQGLKEAMAMGADQAIVIADPLEGAGGTQVSVEVIARAVEKLGGMDLILCGEASIDGASYQFVPRLAERLRIPHVSAASGLRMEADSALIDRNLVDRSETLKVRLPVVLSVNDEINTPTKPTLMQVLKAKDKPVEVWSLEADLGTGVEELQADAPARLASMHGIQVERRQEVLKGLEPKAAAEQLLALLAQEGVLSHD